MHEIRRHPGLREHIRVAVPITAVHERAAAGRRRHALREIAPKRDGAQAFVEKQQCRLGSLDPLVLERMTGGGNLRHQSRLACSMRFTVWLALAATLLLWSGNWIVA